MTKQFEHTCIGEVRGIPTGEFRIRETNTSGHMWFITEQKVDLIGDNVYYWHAVNTHKDALPDGYKEFNDRVMKERGFVI